MSKVIENKKGTKRENEKNKSELCDGLFISRELDVGKIDVKG